MNELIDWYNELSNTEQKIIKIGVPVLIVILLIAALFKLNASISYLENEVTRNKEAVTLLAPLSKSTRNTSTRTNSQQKLTQIITDTTRRKGFSLSKMNEKNDEVEVAFNNLQFDKMIEWLTQLKNRYGVESTSIKVNQTDAVGMVRVTVKLRK